MRFLGTTLFSDCVVRLQVTETARVFLKGLYNPYTAAGTIVVDGVAATVHSRWFLDASFDRLGLTAHIPAAYQASFPAWILSWLPKLPFSLAVSWLTLLAHCCVMQSDCLMAHAPPVS